jgi:hypothetical protein
MLDAREFFGEGCLAGQPLHMASASATAESAIVRIEKDAMIRALHDEPAQHAHSCRMAEKASWEPDANRLRCSRLTLRSSKSWRQRSCR